MKRSLTAAWMLAGTVPLACAGRQGEPQVASSASETSYAVDYPADLQAVTNDYVNSEGDVRRLTTGFARFPEQLKDPPWPVVAIVVGQADQAGRSEGYVDAHRELDQTARFFSQERDDISRRMVGSIQYSLKKGDKGEKSDKPQCDVDVSGLVGPSLKDAVEKEQEKRLRAHDEASYTIERNRETLGRANAATAEKQADDISEASYLVYIHAVELKARASTLVDEASRVRDTLSRSQDEEKAFQSQPGRSAADKRASSERVAKLETAKSKIDGTLPQLSALVHEIDQRNDALRKEYEIALDGLKKTISSKSTAR
ncbi:MAG TPA: hypothetical protein VGL13_09370 [Polyangiaceae bacterium]|jgi:hypothetical protein